MQPNIRPCADLRNNYNEISQMCKDQNEPVFITKNGRGDMAVMSIELYNQLAGKLELYKLIDTGLDDAKNGRVRSYKKAMIDLRKKIDES